MQTPLLILSDHPNSSSGLGRITRDLATRMATKMTDEFKVATIGPNGTYSSSLPFPQYTARLEGWSIPELPQVWRDFSPTGEGIILSVWDMSRLAWLVDPQMCPTQDLAGFIQNSPIKKWSYAPIDAEAPNGGLSYGLKMVAEKFDRLLAYTRFGADVVDVTFPDKKCHHLSHGIDTKEFSPVPEAREQFSGMMQAIIPDDVLLMGVVATNQARKDWPLAFETLSLLKQEGVDCRLWAHTDTFNRYWDLGAMVKDFDVEGLVIPTMGQMTVDQLACGYSACDVTLSVGSEGFGYCAAESLACGTPCVAGFYAASSEIVTSDWLIPPVAYRYDGAFNSKRPVYSAEDWKNKVLEIRNSKASLHPSYDWDNLWPKWQSWLKEGR